MATKINKSIGHDRMTFKATFASGEVLKFNISRTRDSFSIDRPVGTVSTKDEAQKIFAWLKWREGTENHMDRFVRAEALCLRANSISELAKIAA